MQVAVFWSYVATCYGCCRQVAAVTQNLSYLRPKRKPMYRAQGRKKVSTIRCFLLICKSVKIPNLRIDEGNPLIM